MIRQTLARFYHSLPFIRELHNLQASLSESQRQLLALKTHWLLDFDLSQHPRYSDPLRLHRYQAQVCSQNGEDGIINEIFRRIGTTSRVFVEVGVGTGYENNTAFLLSQGWSGYWIDGDAQFTRALSGRDDLAGGVKYLVDFISRENIASAFEQLGVPGEFDLLSLDIDQNTYHAWEGLSKFRPRVVVVEYNAAIPPDVSWTVNYRSDRMWNGTQNFGASLKAFELLGRTLGYNLVGCEIVGANAFFVRDDLVGDKFSAPFTAENHHEPPRYALSRRTSHPPEILDRKPAEK